MAARSYILVLAAFLGASLCVVHDVRGENDGADTLAPVKFETIANHLRVYRGRVVQLEGRVVGVDRNDKGASVTVAVQKHRIEVRCGKSAPEVRVNDTVVWIARIPVAPELNYLEFIKAQDEDDPVAGELAKAPFDGNGEALLLEMINKEREKAGLRPYRLNQKLQAAARKHCLDMQKHNFLGHESKDGSTVADRVKAEGLIFIAVGESVGSAPSADAAHKGFMDSQGHRSNILHKDFEEIGIGIIRTDDRGFIITEVFLLSR